MADSFYALIWQQLSKDYDMVAQPGDDTLHAQVAIVDAEQSMPVLDIISTIPAPMNVLALGSAIKNLATSKPAFTGETSVEWKILDSRTGEVLAAGVDVAWERRSWRPIPSIRGPMFMTSSNIGPSKPGAGYARSAGNEPTVSNSKPV